MKYSAFCWKLKESVFSWLCPCNRGGAQSGIWIWRGPRQGFPLLRSVSSAWGTPSSASDPGCCQWLCWEKGWKHNFPFFATSFLCMTNSPGARRELSAVNAVFFLNSPRIWSLPWCFSTPRDDLEQKSQFPLYCTFHVSQICWRDENQLCPPPFPPSPTKGWGDISKEGFHSLGWNLCFLRAPLCPWNSWALNIWNYSSLQELKCKNAAEVEDARLGSDGNAGVSRMYSGLILQMIREIQFQTARLSLFERPLDTLIISNQSFTASKLK